MACVRKDHLRGPRPEPKTGMVKRHPIPSENRKKKPNQQIRCAWIVDTALYPNMKLWFSWSFSSKVIEFLPVGRKVQGRDESDENTVNLAKSTWTADSVLRQLSPVVSFYTLLPLIWQVKLTSLTVMSLANIFFGIVVVFINFALVSSLCYKGFWFGPRWIPDRDCPIRWFSR